MTKIKLPQRRASPPASRWLQAQNRETVESNQRKPALRAIEPVHIMVEPSIGLYYNQVYATKLSFQVYDTPFAWQAHRDVVVKDVW